MPGFSWSARHGHTSTLEGPQGLQPSTLGLRVLAFLPWVLMQEGSHLVASLRVVFSLP